MDNFIESHPTVSIVVPTFNRKSLVHKCVCSILDQDYENWELIIVDDSSTDGTQAFLEHISKCDTRIRYLDKTGVRGASASRNLGLYAANGEYVIFLDSDDLLAPFCLSQRLEYISGKKNLDFAVFPQLLVRNIPGDSTVLVNVPSDEDDLSRFLTIGQYIDVPWINGAPIWRRESLESFGVYWKENILGYQDVQIHMDAIISGMKYEYAKNTLPDCYWRMHEGERIGRQLETVEALLSHEELLFEIWEKICSSDLPKDRYRKRIFKCILFLCLTTPKTRKSSFERSRIIKRLKARGLLANKEFVNLYLENSLISIFSFSDTLKYKLDRSFRKRAIRLYPKEGQAGFCRHQAS